MLSKDCTKSLYGLADFHQPLFEFLEQGFPFGVDELVGFQGLLDFLEVLGFGHVPQGGAIAFQAADVPVGFGWVRPSFPSCFPS